jgi:chemotaxis protein histidine kinase CheA
MRKNIHTRKIVAALLALLISVSHSASAAEDRGAGSIPEGNGHYSQKRLQELEVIYKSAWDEIKWVLENYPIGKTARETSIISATEPQKKIEQEFKEPPAANQPIDNLENTKENIPVETEQKEVKRQETAIDLSERIEILAKEKQEELERQEEVTKPGERIELEPEEQRTTNQHTANLKSVKENVLVEAEQEEGERQKAAIESPERFERELNEQPAVKYLSFAELERDEQNAKTEAEQNKVKREEVEQSIVEQIREKNKEAEEKAEGKRRKSWGLLTEEDYSTAKQLSNLEKEYALKQMEGLATDEDAKIKQYLQHFWGEHELVDMEKMTSQVKDFFLANGTYPTKPEICAMMSFPQSFNNARFNGTIKRYDIANSELEKLLKRPTYDQLREWVRQYYSLQNPSPTLTQITEGIRQMTLGIKAPNLDQINEGVRQIELGNREPSKDQINEGIRQNKDREIRATPYQIKLGLFLEKQQKGKDVPVWKIDEGVRLIKEANFGGNYAHLSQIDASLHLHDIGLMDKVQEMARKLKEEGRRLDS